MNMRGHEVRSTPRRLMLEREVRISADQIDVRRRRHFPAGAMPVRAEVVPEADGWSLFTPGLPLAPNGLSLENR
jgi:hypothetical protein